MSSGKKRSVRGKSSPAKKPAADVPEEQLFGTAFINAVVASKRQEKIDEIRVQTAARIKKLLNEDKKKEKQLDELREWNRTHVNDFIDRVRAEVESPKKSDGWIPFDDEVVPLTVDKEMHIDCPEHLVDSCGSLLANRLAAEITRYHPVRADVLVHSFAHGRANLEVSLVMFSEGEWSTPQAVPAVAPVVVPAAASSSSSSSAL